ncbi:hypothetical protein NDU88_000237 [Pleurodeles waltl]|uniref:Uncharacterized protein n=1 Tax=Pleurodeles waltl TaxID=8319 RepID=A0AAV7UPY4_PLEWA|nr:hypothetical protein NDU88_000237 [Pleurodeles waltl]
MHNLLFSYPEKAVDSWEDIRRAGNAELQLNFDLSVFAIYVNPNNALLLPLAQSIWRSARTFLFALRRLGPKKQPVASLGEAWRLSPHRAAPPGCSGRGGTGRSRVAPLLREERGSARQSGCSRGAARGVAWAAGRAFPLAPLALRGPGIEG